MILTSDDEWAARCRSERNLCFVPERRFLHYEIGDNYRLTNIQAALGCSQLDRLDAIVTRKREIASRYRDHLWHRPEIRMQERRDWADPVYWIVGVVLNEDTGLTAPDCMKALASAGIETRPFFLGMHEQPVYLRQGLFQGERYPVTERLARQGFYLPNGLDLSDEEISYVCDNLLRVIEEA
jgi:perosamine synthetase